MRIIAGTARSLPLKTIEGLETRPTTDKIKETLFNILQGDVPGSYFLDLFAGSGQIGLEAASRGARYVVLVDNSKKAAACIEENIRFTKFGDVTKLICSDAVSALRGMEGKYRFDLIFMDPPYDKSCEKQILEYLRDSSLMKPETRIVVEASKQTSFDYLEDMGYQLERVKSYKTNAHVFIRRNGGHDS